MTPQCLFFTPVSWRKKKVKVVIFVDLEFLVIDLIFFCGILKIVVMVDPCEFEKALQVVSKLRSMCCCSAVRETLERVVNSRNLLARKRNKRCIMVP